YIYKRKKFNDEKREGRRRGLPLIENSLVPPRMNKWHGSRGENSSLQSRNGSHQKVEKASGNEYQSVGKITAPWNRHHRLPTAAQAGDLVHDCTFFSTRRNTLLRRPAVIFHRLREETTRSAH
uniref:Ovule protein n=1 Tax=Bursaphelenchus xylophilus TaxID=6326 RepID=A0A1I7SHR3_BURXY